MKKIHYISLFLILTLGNSCNKWLDVKPATELDQSELFSSEQGYSEALTGVYANLTKPELYGREMTWGTLDVIGGIYFPNITGEYNSILNYLYKRENSNYSTQAATKVDGIWRNMYTQIANLNALLENIDKNKSVFSGDNYAIIKGEALGLRAFLHFELLKLFGPSYASGLANTMPSIPYVASLSREVAPLLSVENCMQFILNDLKEAKTLMANDPMHLGTSPSSVLAPAPAGSYANYGIAPYHNRRFTFNYYAVVATLARVYLWKGDKENALINAKEIIQEQSNRFPWVKSEYLSKPENIDKWDQDRTFATEHIFAVNIRAINKYMEGYCYFQTTSITLSDLAPWAYLSYGNVFEGGTDIRQLYLSSSQNTSLYCNKYYQVPNVYPFFQQRVPLIRVSEMFYIAAECEPNTILAIGYLDQVRSHRGLGSSPLSQNLSRVELDQEIRKEYRKEFIAEGQFWYYLKRKDVDITNTSAESSDLGIYYFTNKNQYIFDRPVEEDGNR